MDNNADKRPELERLLMAAGFPRKQEHPRAYSGIVGRRQAPLQFYPIEKDNCPCTVNTDASSDSS
ncbi:hypothetical protein [Paenibacillus sp. UMB4589-SE434]|uniref:hypothetical protein n=1 Tax=Paenibacillus sp. UMB4589-SE434 TaxID=3046314 RepID=UPI002551B1F7|nr:hypothetical protein [Paenibacillus sp. UMB4589-SE434]MDK8183402.1 hypothetical protein [Paenibacillus sp. UMB4589-SE434]